MAQIPKLTEADYKYMQERDRRKEIKMDRDKIATALAEDNLDNLRNLHRYLDSKYGASIKDWGISMYEYSSGLGFDYSLLGQQALRENLYAMQAKLEGFEHGWNETTGRAISAPRSDVSVTVNNEINVNLSFEQVRNQIEDMTSLTNEQTQEILDKINEIESVVNSTDKKKTKWEKIKPVLIWLADKSFDVGVALLPLLLKI